MDTLEKTFQLRKSGTTVRTEFLAGATTFATMAYICILHPLYMKQAGMDAVGVLLATWEVGIGMAMISAPPF